MYTMKTLKKNLFFFLIALSTVACSDDSDDSGQEETPILSSIELTSSSGTSLEVGQTTTLTVRGIDQMGQTITINAAISWSTDNANASVSALGQVTAVSAGNSVITASVGTVQGSISLSIIEAVPVVTYDIYVSDANGFGTGPWKILRYDQNGSNSEVFIDTNLAWPQDIVFLEEENEVLISNLNSGRITRYNASDGTYIDNFATGIGGPTRMKFGSDGLLYVLQWAGNGRVLRFQRDGTPMGEFTSFGVNTSIGLDWDSSGNLYVSSFEDLNVRRFNSNGEDQGLFISSGLAGPTDIFIDPSGDFLINDWQGGRIARYDSSGAADGSFATGLSQVEGIAVLPTGNYLVGNGGDGSVKEFTPNGQFVQNVVAPGAGGLSQPNAVVIRILE